MMTIRQLLNCAVVAASALCLQPAMAHGEGKARHGGVIQTAHDLTFELVTDSEGVTVYLMDHDAPMSSAPVRGKLTVLQGGKKIEADLKPAGDNKLRAAGIKLSKGDKAVAVLDKVAGKTVTVRFAIK